MKSTKWIKIFFGLFLFGVLFIGGINYIVDPYGFNNRFKIDRINLKKYCGCFLILICYKPCRLPSQKLLEIIK